jgi:hypothetical protein
MALHAGPGTNVHRIVTDGIVQRVMDGIQLAKAASLN